MTEQGHYGNPWSPPVDTSGEEMQTDVMRFMAILGLCLVAIFALVQSLPLAPAVPPEPPAPAPRQSLPAPGPESRDAPVQRPGRVTDSAADAGPTGTLPSRVIETPAFTGESAAVELLPARARRDEPDSAQPVVASPVDPPVPEETSEGFTLRFDSDQALRVLVAKGEVQFFGVSAGKAWRLASGEQLAFVSARPPGSFHEMTRSTIPESVLRAFRRQVPVPSDEASWGVTLPDPMRASVQAMLQRYRGGELIIMEDGSVRREAGGQGTGP